MVPDRPFIRELAEIECGAILGRNHVGRLAFSHNARVEVQPIHYVYVDGWIYGRTCPGIKIESLRHNWWVAFEVDEAEDVFSWRSVIVQGGFYRFTPNGGPTGQEGWERAVEAIRQLMPEAFTEQDPVPFRTVVFGIAVQEMTGRESAPVLAVSQV